MDPSRHTGDIDLTMASRTQSNQVPPQIRAAECSGLDVVDIHFFSDSGFLTTLWERACKECGAFFHLVDATINDLMEVRSEASFSIVLYGSEAG